MAKDWRSLEADVRQLYCVENRRLRDVMRIIRARHNFKASERSYRTQLRKWGYMKYNIEDGSLSSQTPGFRRLGHSSSTARAGPSACFIPAVPTPVIEPSSTFAESNPATSSRATLSDHIFFEDDTNLPHEPTMPPSTQGGPQLHSSGVSGSAFYRADGRSLLHLAVFAQDKVEVEAVLCKRFLVHHKDALGNEALHYAAERGSGEIVNLLIDCEARVNARGRLGQTPLHLAASRNIASILLRRGADATMQDDEGNTPAHLAVRFSTPEMGENSALHILVDHQRSVLNTPNRSGVTPFHKVLENHRLGLDFFIHRGASVAMPFPNGRTPLMVLLGKLGDFESWVTRYDWADTVHSMIDNGADPDTLLPTGKSLTLEYIEILPSMGHVFRADMPLGRTLCQYGELIPPAYTGITPGDSLLHTLSKNCGREDGAALRFGTLFNVVLGRGADPNIRDENGRTPLVLLLVTDRNDPEEVIASVKYLISYGANPWIPDSTGANAILAAAESPRYSETCLHYLLRTSLESQKGISPKPDRRSLLQHCRLQEWLSAVDADEWVEAMKWIDASDPLLILEDLKTCAVKVLAEWHLETSPSRFREASNGIEKRRRYNARIIRDCHRLGIRLDFEYYDYLLGLCL